MKLKKYTIDDVKRRKLERCMVRITTAGSWTFSSDASLALNLGQGSRIFVHQDQERPADWYIQVTDDPKGIKCRRNVSSGAVSFQSTFLAGELFKSIGVTDKTVKLPVSHTPTDSVYFAIITRAAQKYASMY